MNETEQTTHHHNFTITHPDVHTRLDVFVHTQLGQLSRTRVQELIKTDFVSVNGTPHKANYRLRENDSVQLRIPPLKKLDVEPENIPIDILYEDDDLLVLNKQAGIVVHPGAGTPTGTLVNALLFHCADLSGIGGVERPGIVHRLDKDTSGCLIIAKNDKAHQDLTRQFSQRMVQKEYLALVKGTPNPAKGKIEGAIGRNPKDRKQMAVTKNGKEAVTFYETEKVFNEFSQVRLFPKTGRTHQIRVHMQFIHHPLLGDTVYANRACLSVNSKKVPRQMLHAHKITFTHPTSGKQMSFVSPIPNDMLSIIEQT